MPRNLQRITGFDDLHFVTFCCYERRALLGKAQARDRATRILDEVRERYRFSLVGYVLMPEHVHLLISESRELPASRIMQIFKQRVSRALRGNESDLRRFWQRRYYDFNVCTWAKLQEKLHYIHSNPVRARLAKHPGDWPWSSWCYYYRGQGLLRMDPWGQAATSERKSDPPFLKPKG